MTVRTAAQPTIACDFIKFLQCAFQSTFDKLLNLGQNSFTCSIWQTGSFGLVYNNK